VTVKPAIASPLAIGVVSCGLGPVVVAIASGWGAIVIDGSMDSNRSALVLTAGHNMITNGIVLHGLIKPLQ